LGLLELLRHYQEIQADSTGALRRVWLFKFKIHREPQIVPTDEAANITSRLLNNSLPRNDLNNLESVVLTILPGEKGTERMLPLEIEQVRFRLMQLAPYDFEKFARSVMEKNGFTNVSVTSVSGDGGIDINAYVEEASDFFDRIHVQVQVKRWRHAIGSIDINNFRGALSSTAKGIFVTTSRYTRAALLEARHQFKPCITLIDGGRLSGIVKRSGLPFDDAKS
jgi:HJR/Mrr/RecB family endonuclease